MVRAARPGLVVAMLAMLAGSAAAADVAETAPGAGSVAVPTAAAPAASVAAAPSAEAASHPAAAPTDDGARGAEVRVGDDAVYTVKIARGAVAPAARARAATQALERVLDARDPGTARVEREGERAVVYVGATPVLALTEEDARAAGDPSLDAHAAATATAIGEAVRAEARRAGAAHTVYSVSLLVFSALVVFLLLRKLTELGARARQFLRDHPERLPEARIRGMHLVAPGTMRGGLHIALGGGQILLQVSIAYVWILFALSLFEITRPHTKTLTSSLLEPVSTLLGRLVATVPAGIATLVVALVVVIVVRGIGLYFESVARGETRLDWVPPDLAPATSALLRGVVVIIAVLVMAPVLASDAQGPLARAGLAVLVALALAVTPSLASVAIGLHTVFARQLRTGDYVEVGGRAGRVREITLTEIRLEDDHGAEVRVPQLLTLFHPTRLRGQAAPIDPVELDVEVDIGGDPRAVRELLLVTAREHALNVSVDLLSMGGGRACFGVVLRGEAATNATEVAFALTEALGRAGVPLVSLETAVERA